MRIRLDVRCSEKGRGGERGEADLGGDGSLGGHHDKRKHSVKKQKTSAEVFSVPGPLLHKRR